MINATTLPLTEEEVDEGTPLLSPLSLGGTADRNKFLDDGAVCSGNSHCRKSGGQGGGDARSASVFRTSMNVAKFCMGTGTLALPYASERGGLVFNALGLVLIGAWDYGMSLCLIGCLDLLPVEEEVKEEMDGGKGVRRRRDGSCIGTEAIDGRQIIDNSTVSPLPPAAPPPGTTAYGRVAWYAFGPKGLIVLDVLMLSLLFGLVIAYEAAMMSFIQDTPLTTGSRNLDLLVPNVIVIALSCALNIGFLGNFSGLGLIALTLSVVIISWQGFVENGCGGFWDAPSLNLWPGSLSAASSWFGVAVFSYGVAPFVFHFRDSMRDPQQVGFAVWVGLLIVCAGYIVMSNGIRVLFSPSHVFDGDILKAMNPDSWISLLVRLLMTVVVALTTPLVVVPCGELIEGKLGMNANDDGHQQRRFLAPKRILIRVLIIAACMAFSEYVPNGFVDFVSFIGCFCGATTGFILPPLFRMKLSTKIKPWTWGNMDRMRLCDVSALVLALVATAIASFLTFCELISKVATDQ